MTMSDDRNLTDKDVEAIVDSLKEKLVTDFYGEVGRGFWGWVKKAIFVLLFILALQGILGDRAFLSQIVAQHKG